MAEPPTYRAMWKTVKTYKCNLKFTNQHQQKQQKHFV